MSHLDAHRGIPISDRLTDDVLVALVARLPRPLQENLLAIMLMWYENHPDVPIHDFVLGLSDDTATSFPMPFGGEFVADRRGFEVELKRLPEDLLRRLRIFVTLVCEF